MSTYNPESGGGMRAALPSVTPMVRKLMIINAVVFVALLLIDFLPGGGFGGLAHRVSAWGGVNSAIWVEHFPLLPVWQVVTWGFIHTLDDPYHILMNMMFLYFLGTMLEGLIGSRCFLAAYVGGILISGVGTLLIGVGEELFSSGAAYGGWATTKPTIGASGAVMTVVVAMATLRPRAQMIFVIVPVTLKVVAMIFVGLDIYGILRSDSADNVAHWAHLLGAGWGYLIVRKGWIYRDPLEALEKKQAARVAERQQTDQQQLDVLLGRIHRDGIGTLSKSEREFMKRVSKRD
jgi:membrane associated rhomboid family serine protease